MQNDSMYYKYCYQMLDIVRPNRVFELKLMSRIYWQNLVFCSHDINSGEMIAIKIFLNTFGAKDRYSRDIYFSKLFSKEMKSFKSIDAIHHQVFNSDEIKGALIQSWIPGITWMNKIQMDFESFIHNDLIDLKNMFQELWSVKMDTLDDNANNLLIFEADTDYPSLLKYKLDFSEELAFRCLYHRLPSFNDKISRLQLFYQNYRNKAPEKYIVNGDPSAHEFIINDGYTKWIDWEYVLYGYPMMDIAYMFYSLAHNFYNDENNLKKLEQRYFCLFEICKNPMFVFYFIEKIVMVENTTDFQNDIDVLIWSINYAYNLIKETE